MYYIFLFFPSFFLSFIGSLWTSHHVSQSTHLPVPPSLHISPLPMQLPSPQKNKQQTKKLLTTEAEECHSVSHSIPFAQTAWLANAHCIASLEWIKPFASATLSILGPHQDSSLRYPVLALCHWHSAALILQDWPLHELRQLIGGVDVEVGHL